MKTVDVHAKFDRISNSFEVTCNPDIMAMYFRPAEIGGVFVIPSDAWKIVSRRMKADDYIVEVEK